MNQALQERKVNVGNQEMMDIRVRQGSQVPVERLVSRDLLDLLGFLVKQDPRARREFRDSLGRKDPEVPLESQVLRVWLVCRGPEGRTGIRDPTGFPVFLVFRVRLDPKAKQVSVVITVWKGGRDFLARGASLDYLESSEREGQQGQRARWVYRETEDRRVLKAWRGWRETKA